MLSDREFVPQFLCSGMIREVHNLEGKAVPPYWQLDKERFQEEIGELHRILQSLQ